VCSLYYCNLIASKADSTAQQAGGVDYTLHIKADNTTSRMLKCSNMHLPLLPAGSAAPGPAI
jgi:hypothetical protein